MSFSNSEVSDTTYTIVCEIQRNFLDAFVENEGLESLELNDVFVWPKPLLVSHTHTSTSK